MSWLENPAVSWMVPMPLLLAAAPLLWRIFGDTWRELEREAHAHREALRAAGEIDWRPVVAMALGVFVLALQQYYGKRPFYEAVIRPALAAWERTDPGGPVALERYDALYSHAWWGLMRIGGYLLPLAAWPLLFQRDSVLDFGLRLRGVREHLWIYAASLAVMVPVLLLVRTQADFGAYYPFYRQAGRSWLDFFAWEAVYVAQFFALEVFFRGWWIRATRALGVGAIFGMVVPYTMIHFGKPWLEASGAIVAGVVLGSLSMRTRSIYAGFLVHASVAVLMDFLALERRGQLPELLTSADTGRFAFGGWWALLWGTWAAALGVLALEAWRWRRRAGVAVAPPALTAPRRRRR